MVDLDHAVSLLEAKRKELAEQLDAVDKALAALSGLDGARSAAPPATPPTPAETDPGIVVPTRVEPRRTLSDEHKHALSEGRRKARHSKAVAAGLAREPSDALPPGSSAGGRPPRLVKRTK